MSSKIFVHFLSSVKMSHCLFNHGLDCDSNAVNSITIGLLSVALAIQCTVCVRATIDFYHHPKTDTNLKILFYMMLLLALLAIICDIVGTTIEMLSNPYPRFNTLLIPLTNNLFLVFLLITLFLRLHITFNDSAYSISKCKSITFIIILISMLLCCSVYPIIFMVTDEYRDWTDSLFWILYGAGFTFYGLFLIGSALAIGFFVGNLSKLAMLRSNSARDLSITEDAISLDKHQQRLSDLSARYLLLFLIASTSTVLCSVLSYLVLGNLAGVFISMDSCVNVVCLYLQFGFAQDYYHRFCGYCNGRCIVVISQRMRRSIYRKITGEKLDKESCSNAQL